MTAIERLEKLVSDNLEDGHNDVEVTLSAFDNGWKLTVDNAMVRPTFPNWQITNRSLDINLTTKNGKVEAFVKFGKLDALINTVCDFIETLQA